MQATYLRLITIRRFDIVHDIDVDIVQNDTGFRHVRSFPQNATENNARFCGRYFDSGFDALEAMRGNRINRRSFHYFEISKGRKIQAKILQGVSGLIYQENV